MASAATAEDFTPGNPVIKDVAIKQDINQTASDETDIAGLLIKPNSTAKLTFHQDVAIGAVDGTTNNNAYSILLKSGDANFVSNDQIFRKITISALPTNGKETYVFKNAGSGAATFTNVGIAAGDPASLNSAKAGLFVNIANSKFDFGSTEQAKTIFNVQDSENDVYGAYLKINETELKGNLELKTTASAQNKNSTGIYATGNHKILGNVIINATGDDKAKSIGFVTEGNTTLKLSKTSTNEITINAASKTDAVGLHVKTGTLNIQDEDGGKLGLNRFVFKVGNEFTKNAVGLAFETGRINGDIEIGETSTIGTEEAGQAIAVYFKTGGTPLNDQNITVKGKLLGKEKYIIKSEVALNLTNKKITGGSAKEVAEAYGLYNGIADGIYDFIADSIFNITGANNQSASAIIIKDTTTINGALTLTAKGGTAQAENKNGGNAIGLDIQSLLTLNAKTPKTLQVTVEGGAKHDTGANGDATGIKLHSTEENRARLDASKVTTLTLKVGETTATNAIALDMNHASFTGSFTANQTNKIGNAQATSATLIKNTGNSSIENGKITLESGGLVAKDRGAKILDNTGVLTFKNTSLQLGGGIAALTTDKAGFAVTDLGDQKINFGSTEGAKTVFEISDNQNNVYGAYLEVANTELSGNLEFNSTATKAGKNATGIYSKGAQKILGNVAIVADSKEKAVGLHVEAGNLTIKDPKITSNFTFNIGNTDAKTATAINLKGASAKIGKDNEDIVIKQGSVIGNETNATTATALHLDTGATFTNQSIVVEEGVRFLTKDGGQKYILNNAVNTQLTFTNDANATQGNHTITVGKVLTNAETYGLYSNIADVGYNFGTIPAIFTITGKDGTEASGLLLGANTRFEGKARFTITDGNAYGIKVIGDTTLTVADDAVLTFTQVRGKSATGESAGIFVKDAKLTMAKEEKKRNGQIVFSEVGADTQAKSIGIKLDQATFDGSITFSSIKVKDAEGSSVIGISNANESTIKNGNIVFANDVFGAGTKLKKIVIDNQGTLTINKYATISAGDNTQNIKVALFNGIDGAIYNLGNFNLNAGLFAEQDQVKPRDYAIYSTNNKSVFNVTAGSTVNISADEKTTKAFGGEINLNLAKGETTKIYLNTDGGTIKNLVAGENATIYLSGTNKNKRVGDASSIDYRTLEINLMDSGVQNKTAATEVQKGANFVVLVDSNRANGAGAGAAYTADGKKSKTGGSDRIIVKHDAATQKATDSGLGVGVTSLNTSGEKKYAVLAQVDKTDIQGKKLHDLVTFNGLKKDGDEALVTSQVGFDVATIAIRRHDLGTEEQVGDWNKVGAVYVSDMIARATKIDENVVNTTLSAINTNFDLISANLNSLSKRLGELRNSDNAHGLWGRVFAGQETSKFGIEQTSTYLTFQAGYDYKASLENASNYTGFALSYVHSSSKQATAQFLTNEIGSDKVYGNATSTSNGVELALYNTYVADMGLYSDSIVKFGYFSSDLNLPAQANTYKIDNLAAAVSEEVGYKVKLGEQNEWFITPQAELAYAFINGSEFTQYIGKASLKTTQDAISLLRTRAGVAWGYNFDHYGKDNGVKASLYLGTYYAYDAILNGNTNMLTSNGTQQGFNGIKSNGRFVLNVGTDVQVQDKTKFYVDFEKSFGNMMQTDYQVSVGVRFGFGEKTSNKKEDKNKAALKLKEAE